MGISHDTRSYSHSSFKISEKSCPPNIIILLFATTAVCILREVGVVPSTETSVHILVTRSNSQSTSVEVGSPPNRNIFPEKIIAECNGRPLVLRYYSDYFTPLVNSLIELKGP